MKVNASWKDVARGLRDQNSEQKVPKGARFVIGLSSVVIQGDGFQIKLPKFVVRVIARITNVL